MKAKIVIGILMLGLIGTSAATNVTLGNLHSANPTTSLNANEQGLLKWIMDHVITITIVAVIGCLLIGVLIGAFGSTAKDVERRQQGINGIITTVGTVILGALAIMLVLYAFNHFL